MKRLCRPHRDERRGASVVEMALIAPVFFAVVLGIIEFGRGMMVSQLVTNAAREGARMASIAGNSNADVEQAVTDFLQETADVGAGDVTVTISVDNADADDEVGNASRGDACTVRVAVPFEAVQYTVGDYLTGANLVGQAVMRRE